TPHHEVRHLNGIRTDNRPENLAWGTKSENMQDAVRHGTHLETRKTHCPEGHEYTPENTIMGGRNRKSRGCKKCISESKKRLRMENRLGDNPDDPRHGTTTGRFTYGCECERCKSAAKHVWQRHNARKKKAA